MPQRYVEAIRNRKLSIYDVIEIEDQEVWIPMAELEILLNSALKGISLAGLPLRSRSKVVKQHVCHALGYPVPSKFKRTQPRFPGQLFDIYIQKSNNLQIWNEKLTSTRRYVLIQVGQDDVIGNVKVVTGDILERFDTTGVLTQKYQARLKLGVAKTELIAGEDTELLKPFLKSGVDLTHIANPVNNPQQGELLPIKEVFERLLPLIGFQFNGVGIDQERNRGEVLHRLVCKTLGYANYQDDGQFPDIRHQLLEVKLQTSPTIDLGLVRPNSLETLRVPKIKGQLIRHCDVRYVLFYALTNTVNITLTHLFLTTGEKFFDRFPQFQGKVLNKKLQIPLPADFFCN